MENSDSTDRKTWKAQYNREYYKRNKKRFRKNKDMAKTFLRLLPKGAQPAQSGLRLNLWLKYSEIFILLVLVLAMTVFLIREAAAFYIEGQESAVSAYFKAAMVESIVIVFSFAKGNHFLFRWAQRTILVLLCVLTIWTMSSRFVNQASAATAKYHSLEQQVAALEADLGRRVQVRDEYLKRGWLGAIRTSERSFQELQQATAMSKIELAHLQKPPLLLNSVWILILFRVLIAFSNLLVIHHVNHRTTSPSTDVIF